MTDETAAAPPGAGKTLLILVAVAVVIAAYLGLAVALRIAAPFMGFLFLLYWATIRQADPREFAPSLFGAVGGLALAWLVSHGPGQFGTAGIVVALALVLGATYLFIRQQFRQVVNIAFMLFLTIGSIPALAAQDDYPGLILGVAYGAAFFGGLFFLVTRLTRAKATAKLA